MIVWNLFSGARASLVKRPSIKSNRIQLEIIPYSLLLCWVNMTSDQVSHRRDSWVKLCWLLYSPITPPHLIQFSSSSSCWDFEPNHDDDPKVNYVQYLAWHLLQTELHRPRITLNFTKLLLRVGWVPTSVKRIGYSWVHQNLSWPIKAQTARSPLVLTLSHLCPSTFNCYYVPDHRDRHGHTWELGDQERHNQKSWSHLSLPKVSIQHQLKPHESYINSTGLDYMRWRDILLVDIYSAIYMQCGWIVTMSSIAFLIELQHKMYWYTHTKEKLI